MNISIIGIGYVGLVTGVCFAKLGNDVICVDVDQEKIEMINRGVSPIYEEGLEQLLVENKGRIEGTRDYEYAIQNTDVTFICVGTPSRDDGGIDLKFVKEAAEEIGKQLRSKDRWHLVVVKSTVLPGTTGGVVLPLLERHSGKKAGVDFGVAMNPEFLREGVAVRDFLEPDRIVIGYYDDKSREVLRRLYSGFSCSIVETSLSAAEMIKYASNAFLATKISFINEIGNICKKLGIDTYEVADGMGLDKRIGRAFLDSGIGWGGSCFPKDTKALVRWSEEIKEELNIVRSAIVVNEKQPLRVIELLRKHLLSLKGKTIGVLGLAFKPDTDDVRDSRSIPIVEKLLEEGATVKVFDPKAMNNFKKVFPHITYCSSAVEVLEDCEAVLILTKWDEFRKLDYSGKIVVDGRRVLEAKKTARIYEGVCW